MSFFESRQKGFTLIEITVAIAIIGMLVAAIYAGLGETRKKARDAERMSDLQQVQLALRQYKDVHGSYPDHAEGVRLSSMQAELAQFFPKVLQDPFEISDSATYGYVYKSNVSCDDGVSRAVVAAITMEQSQNTNLDNATCSAGSFQNQDGSSYLLSDTGFVLILK